MSDRLRREIEKVFQQAEMAQFRQQAEQALELFDEAMRLEPPPANDQAWTAAMFRVVPAMKGRTLGMLRDEIKEVYQRDDEGAVREFLAFLFFQMGRAYERHQSHKS